VLRLEAVAFLDPRAVALRDAMGVETSAIYADAENALPPEVREDIGRALAIVPEHFVDTVIAVDGTVDVGHAALRRISTGSISDALEVKKVFVSSSHRGRGISRVIMEHLETVARARGIRRLVLQTGDLQHAAIALYESLGYTRIPAFGLYTLVPFEVCFEKTL
jgi:GNAT superfamily N-acetyltransferase